MGFPKDVRDRVLIACKRHCCLCEEPKALKIELHHIVQKSEGGEDTFDNCIPLCFDCHADMRSLDHRHPKGSKYTPAELIARRNNWYSRVASCETPPPISTKTGAPRADLPSEEVADQLLWPPLNQYPLRLAVGESGGFFETKRAGSLYVHTRVLKVYISNSDPARILTGCKIYVMEITPHELDGPWLLKEGFSLASGDHTFVPLASYTEPDNIKISPYGDSFIEILVAKNQPLPSYDVQHVLTIRATSLDAPFCEVKCKLWVDEDGRLRIEAIG